MNRVALFSAVRASLFAGKMTANQVTGIEAILDEWAKHDYTDLRWLAYVFATSHHETGAKFVASVENLNYSVDGLLKTFGRHRISVADAKKYGRTTTRPANQEAIANIIYGGQWGRENLGNIEPGDGWLMRGRGLPQLTGRANYTKVGLANNPEAAAEIHTAARVAIEGMVAGVFTSQKLSMFFSPAKDNPIGARQIINPDDNGTKIAGYHRLYLKALREAA